MCGKGSSSGYGGLAPIQQSTTQASPQAIQAYTKALGLADVAAAQPFQQYSTDPNAFVAPLTGTQQRAIGGLYGAQGAYQPYYQGAGQLTASAGTTAAPQLAGQYMNPFMQQVINPVLQQQGQQLAQQQAEAIRGGAFGGERAGLQRQALRGQQDLALGQLYAGGYNQALQTAQGDLARQLQAGQALGALGTGAQTAALQAPQALLGAGTLEQQTQQAGLTALYNQFLQGRAYPYQQAQFYSNIAGGLGPLLGQTTYQSQAQNPFGMFLSEPRAKMGVDGYADGGVPQDRSQPDVVGKTFDDQNIYAYRYKDGSPAQLGLMADEVQRRHPEAVGYAPTGDRMVDYAAATDAAARMGGAVKDTGDYARGGYAIGGHLSYVDPSDPGAADRRRMEALLASHKGGLSGAASEYGPSGESYVTQKTYVPAGTVRAGQQLQHARFEPVQSKGGLGSALETGEKLGSLLSKGYEAYDKYKVSRWPGWGGNEPKMAAGGVPTSYLPEEITGEVRASEPLRPAEISERGQDKESGLSKLMGVGEKALDIGIKYGPMIRTGLTALASMSEPGMKTGVRPAARDGMGIRPANEDDIFEKGIIGAESRGRQFDREGRPLTSPAGAIGIAQVMPGTAPEAARLAGLEFDPVRYRNDPEYNKALGKAYFNKQLETFGSEDKAAAAYNAGPGALQKALARAEREGGDYLSYLPAETRAYVPKVMGLAGARGEGEGIPRVTPEAVSRARSGLGLDRMAGNFTPEQRRMMALDESSRKEGAKEGGLGDYLTSEEFLIPALTGLGTAVTSAMQAPTTSLGAALAGGAGAGVLAGAQQILPTRAKQAEIDKIKAEEQERLAQAGTTRALGLKAVSEIPSGAMIIDKEGRVLGVNVYLPGSSTPTQVSLEEYYRAQSSGRPYSLSPSGGEAPGTQPPPSGTPMPGGGAEPLATPIQPKEVAPTAKDAQAAPSSLSKEDIELAKKYRAEENKMANTALGQYKDIYTPQQEKAEAARDLRNQVLPMSAALSSLPKTGKLSPGPLQAFMAPVVQRVNDIARKLNFEGGPFDENIVANSEEAKKYIRQLQTKAAANGDQKSYAALDAIGGGYPSDLNSSKGLARLLAGVVVDARKEIDKHEYFQNFRQIAGGQRAPMASASWANLDTRYDKGRQGQLQKDKEVLEKLLYENPKIGKEGTFIDAEGKPTKDQNKATTWASWVIKNAGSMTPDQVKQIESIFNAPGILRYLGV